MSVRIEGQYVYGTEAEIREFVENRGFSGTPKQISGEEWEYLIDRAIDIHEVRQGEPAPKEVAEDAYTRGYNEALRKAEERRQDQLRKESENPAWQVEFERMVDDLARQNPGMSRRDAERQLLDSHILLDLTLDKEATPVLKPMKTVIFNFPSTENPTDNFTKIPYIRPAGQRAFATKEHAEKMKALAEEAKTNKKAKDELESESVWKQYNIIRQMAVNNLVYWYEWHQRALDVIAWKEQERELGSKAKMPKWFADDIKLVKEAEEKVRKGVVGPVNDGEKFAYAGDEKVPGAKWQNVWESPTGAVMNREEIATWWKRMTREMRDEEIAAAMADRTENGPALVQMLENLDRRYPVAAGGTLLESSD